MTLSIIKLEKILNKNNFIIRKVFTIDRKILLLEIFDAKKADLSFLYISSKYKLKDNHKYETYKLELIDVDQYKNNINTEYKEVQITENENITNLKDILNNNYDKPIQLNNISTQEHEVTDIHSQLTRLQLCVKNIKYKLILGYKTYFCILTPDNNIKTYIIVNYPENNLKRIYILTDIELLVENIKNVSDTINGVKVKLFENLTYNQEQNNKILHKLLDNKNMLNSDIVSKNIQNINNYIHNLEFLLTKLNISEQKILELLYNIRHKNTVISELGNEVKNSHLIHKYEKEIDKIYSTKEDILKEILCTRAKQDNVMLEIDSILIKDMLFVHNIVKNYENILEIFSYYT